MASTGHRQRGLVLIAVLWLGAFSVLAVGAYIALVRDRADWIARERDVLSAYMLAQQGLDQWLAHERKKRPGSLGGEDESPKGDYKVQVEDAASRINVNRLNEQQLFTIFRRFAEEPEDVKIIVDSILDWRDDNDIKRPNGAESDYYQRHDPPYRAGNGPFRFVGELMLVRKLAELATREELESLFSVGAHSRVNVNTAPREVLAEIPGLEADVIDTLLRMREALAPKGLTEERLRQILPPTSTEQLVDWLSVSESKDRCVHSQGQREGAQFAVELTWCFHGDDDTPYEARFRAVPVADE